MSIARLVPILLVSLLLVGCGSTQTSAPDTTAETPAVAEPTGELTVAIANDPQSMDPRVGTGTTGKAMHRHIFEALIFRNDEMEIYPLLAESWNRVDPTTWEFHLREGVKFHNGEDFDAQSVKYTIESILDPDNGSWVNSQVTDYLSAVQTVEIKDNYTVIIRTNTPSGGLLANLSAIMMVPPKAGSEAGQAFGNILAGTGPYKVVEYVPNSHLKMEANTDYWGELPKTTDVTIRIMPENATRLAALESGEVQLINNLPTDSVDRIKNNPSLKVLAGPTSRLMFLGLQADRPPFDNVLVRQAINYAIDKEGLVQDFFGSGADLVTGPMHPRVGAFNDELEPAPWPYDPEKAKELLAEAGYPDGIKIVYGYPNGRYLMDKQVAEAIVGQLAKVGIECEAETAEWGTFYNNRVEGKYDAYFYGMSAATMHPDPGLQWFGRSRLTGYVNPTVDELLSKADSEFDEAKSEQFYKQAQEIIWEEAAWAWLYYQPALWGASADLEEFALRADEYFLLFDVYLSK